MKKLLFISLLFLVSSCIKNDIPLPTIVPTITAFEVEGADVSISSLEKTVTITLEETTDISKVNITKVEFGEKEVRPSWNLVGTHDFTTSQEKQIMLSTYQDYIWTIKVIQPIERYFTVKGQVGATVIDDANLRAVVVVAGSIDRTKITISSLKLGPKDITTYSPTIEELKDFSGECREIGVTFHGHTQTWSLFVKQTDKVVDWEALDAWTRVVWLRASGIAGEKNGFMLRKKGDTDWIDLPNIAENGGEFSTSYDNLEPLTTYEIYAYCGSDITDTREFTTEEDVQLPNSGFEVVSHAESDKYYSFFDPASLSSVLKTKFWCSGNKGSTTVGASHSITNPDQNDKVEGKQSARLDSDYVVIKFAAGNIFVGEFVKVVGTSGGIIHFGRPFTTRPRKLTIWLKYHSGIITDRCFSKKPDNDPVKVGDWDRCQVWIALGDWDYHKYGGTAECPVQINTLDLSTFFNPKGESVIGYGEYVSNVTDQDWHKVEIPITYYATDRKPTHIIVACAASKLGDYFTGSEDSTLWVDDIKLEY